MLPPTSNSAVFASTLFPLLVCLSLSSFLSFHFFASFIYSNTKSHTFSHLKVTFLSINKILPLLVIFLSQHFPQSLQTSHQPHPKSPIFPVLVCPLPPLSPTQLVLTQIKVPQTSVLLADAMAGPAGPSVCQSGSSPLSVRLSVCLRLWLCPSVCLGLLSGCREGEHKQEIN